MNPKELVDALCRALERSSLSVDIVAKRAGVDSRDVQTLLNGDADVPLWVFERIVHALSLELVLRDPLDVVYPRSTDQISVHSRLRQLFERK